MKLVKTDSREYWINDKDQHHGEFKSWWDNGQLREHFFCVNDEMHGERKWWYKSGKLISHEYWSNGKLVLDFKEEPATDEDKFLLTLECGGQWLCD